jgi:hypothetical protein
MYVRVLRAMTPEQRLRKAFELGATSRAMFEHGLSSTFSRTGRSAFASIVRVRLDRCHNRNY